MRDYDGVEPDSESLGYVLGERLAHSKLSYAQTGFLGPKLFGSKILVYLRPPKNGGVLKVLI